MFTLLFYHQTLYFSTDMICLPSACTLQSCLTLCDPMGCNLPGSSVSGILQARILGSVACSPPRDLANPGTEPPSLMSPALGGEFFTTSAPVSQSCLTFL